MSAEWDQNLTCQTLFSTSHHLGRHTRTQRAVLSRTLSTKPPSPSPEPRIMSYFFIAKTDHTASWLSSGSRRVTPTSSEAPVDLRKWGTSTRKRILQGSLTGRMQQRLDQVTDYLPAVAGDSRDRCISPYRLWDADVCDRSALRETQDICRRG